MPVRGTIPGLALGLLAVCGCSEDSLSSIATVTDEFLQNKSAAVDVLWVVDNSESMREEQQGIGADFQSFVRNLIESSVDYHIGVINTDVTSGGRLHYGARMIPFIHPEIANADSVFGENVFVGTAGARQEKPFESLALALGKGGSWAPPDPINDPNSGRFRNGRCAGNFCERGGQACAIDDDCDQKFLRNDASLFVIIVSDEDDESFGPVHYYWRLVDGHKGAGNEARISVSGIIGPPSSEGCQRAGRGSAAPAFRITELASLTGGIVASICDEFADSLRDLSITAAGLKSIFELSSLPDQSASVPCGPDQSPGFCVQVNGTIVNENRGQGWMYDIVRNAIVFGPNSIPPPESKILVDYRKTPGR